MKSDQGRTPGINKNKFPKSYEQNVFKQEVQKAHNELKNEIERLKLESRINQHISTILERRLTKIKNSIEEQK